MKVAVLGANGFLGQCILRNLIQYTLIPVTRKDLDLTNFEQVKSWLIENQPDVIINAAIAGGSKTGLSQQDFFDVQNNLSIFMNFYNNSNYFSKFINIGSGAEFDLSTNIEHAREEDLIRANPKDSYGYSKNLISRLVLEKDNFYTLRLFGCFDRSEPEFRLFKKFLDTQHFCLIDRQFDYISAKDFCRILSHYLDNDQLPRDINCVYQDKLWLSDILAKFNKGFSIIDTNELHYTGNGEKLNSLNISLDGLELGIKEYTGV